MVFYNPKRTFDVAWWGLLLFLPPYLHQPTDPNPNHEYARNQLEELLLAALLEELLTDSPPIYAPTN